MVESSMYGRRTDIKFGRRISGGDVDCISDDACRSAIRP